MLLDELTAELGEKLKSHNWKITTAESCTGGGLGYWITSRSGSSDWFEQGYITYSNKAKNQLLGVGLETLAQFGAVSEQVAIEMAEKALIISCAQISVSITGIAGPTGGTQDKPVGLVWIAVAGKSFKTHCQRYQFSGGRTKVREQAIIKAVTLVLKML